MYLLPSLLLAFQMYLNIISSVLFAGGLLLQVREKALITNRAAHADARFAAAVAEAGPRLTPVQVAQPSD